jgi:hypothetical protein
MPSHSGPTPHGPIIAKMFQRIEDNVGIVLSVAVLFGGLGWALFLLKSFGWF